MNHLIRSSLDASWKVKYDRRLELLYSSNGPLWYRGYLLDTSLNKNDLRSVLSLYGADIIVVGHTITDTIRLLHEGLVIAIDVTFKNQSKVEALLWENNMFYRVGINRRDELQVQTGAARMQ